MQDGYRHLEKGNGMYKNYLKNKIFTADEEKLILDKLKPKTYLETLMHIDILIHLRKTSQLLEILKKGNAACVSKIIKQPWFLQEVFNNVNAEELVDDILPSMSFSVKMKLLKKLSFIFPEEKMDEVFDAILKWYGIV
ncbi:hypothetical protein NQ314_019314 [Rhamnusium bicolor]|uniref:Uncharacterized protein n=1 Tax=Rhamnusium bicolor TaxID=1586634 RepID=A0AAV8WN31_9CUCU|nr:hypothetical protein NQ314_019314 [Rhamnusium bicolor]